MRHDTTIAIPERMAARPRDPQRPNLPVPWFVPWVDGLPDFRCMDGNKLVTAIQDRRCWLCGLRLHPFGTFVIGPMCALNRVSAEPPSHADCAEYAVQVCPFLSQPKMRRNEKDLPEGVQDGAGVAIRRNPGVSLLWTSADFCPFDDGNGGILFDVGIPLDVSWWQEGRRATRAEVLASIDSGLPLLREMAHGKAANAELDRRYRAALTLLPREVSLQEDNDHAHAF